MKVGIIGSGHIGGTAAKLFVEAGYEVVLASARGPEALREVISALKGKAEAATVEEAARAADVVLVAIPLFAYRTLPPGAFVGKIVIDAMNYYPSRDAHIAELDAGTITSSELVAKHLPGSRVVKAFNTIWSEHLKAQGNTSLPVEKRRAIFLAGDDAEAKRTVAGLIEAIGFGPVDTGDLKGGGAKQQPGSRVYNKDITQAEGAEAVRGA
jgi:predicted dinucleotide-binding enzyme